MVQRSKKLFPFLLLNLATGYHGYPQEEFAFFEHRHGYDGCPCQSKKTIAMLEMILTMSFYLVLILVMSADEEMSEESAVFFFVCNC